MLGGRPERRRGASADRREEFGSDHLAAPADGAQVGGRRSEQALESLETNRGDRKKQLGESESEQASDVIESGVAGRIGQEAEVTDTHKAPGKDVEEKAAQEFAGMEFQDLGSACITVVLPSEGDGVVIEAEQAVIGEGDPVGVTA
jgi:hypothetical protein